MEEKKFKINVNNIMYRFMLFLSFFCLIRPNYLSRVDFFNRIYIFIGIPIVVCIICKYVYDVINEKKVNKLLLVIIVYCFFLMLVALYKGIDFNIQSFSMIINSIGVSILMFISIKKDYYITLDTLSKLLYIYAVINLASIIIFPDTLYTTDAYKHYNWFLGYKNEMIRTLLPALAIYSIKDMYKNKRLTKGFYFLMFVCIYTSWKVDSKTAIVGILLFCIAIIIFSKLKLPKFFNLKTVGLFIIIASITITYFNGIAMFKNFFVLIGEENDISTRILVWDRTINLIKESPIIGYGFRQTTQMRSLINLSLKWTYFSHPHNYVLYILLQGGIVGATMIIYMYTCVAKRCIRFKNSFTAKVLLFMYIAFLIMGLTESLTGATLLYPMMIFTEIFFIEKDSQNSQRGDIVYEKK